MPPLEPGQSAARLIDRIPDGAPITQVLTEADAQARRN